MSQFDNYSAAKYVEGLRVFLKKKRQGFLVENGIFPESHTGKPGRAARYVDEAVEKLENEVNLKAEKSESVATTLGERIRIAKDYKKFSDADVAKYMGVSRELVRLWSENTHVPGDIQKLAQVLDVPTVWLEFGGEMHLPANSHIGVRVGQENFMYRETLYAKTIELIPSIPEDAGLDYVQAFIEYQVNTDPASSKFARRAGGRWQVMNGTLVFAPWVPIEAHQLTRRIWSHEVEAMIAEELSTKPSVYGAWASLRARCLAMGLTEDQFPRKISLHKRVEKERARIAKYGLNLNQTIKSAVEKCSKPH